MAALQTFYIRKLKQNKEIIVMNTDGNTSNILQ